MIPSKEIHVTWKHIVAGLVVWILGVMLLTYGIIHVASYIVDNWGARVSVEARG